MSGSKGQEIVYTWARLNTPTHKELSDTIDAALRRAKVEGVKIWTNEKPAVEGWYWFRTECTEEEICRVYQDADDMWWATCTEWDEVFKLDDVLIGAEWAGPITAPLDARAAQIEEGE